MSMDFPVRVATMHILLLLQQVSSSLNNTACSGDNLYAYNFPFVICALMLYRITGIFCGCLIFAEFCGSIEIAEIKNRKIFQSH